MKIKYNNMDYDIIQIPYDISSPQVIRFMRENNIIYEFNHKLNCIKIVINDKITENVYPLNWVVVNLSDKEVIVKNEKYKSKKIFIYSHPAFMKHFRGWFTYENCIEYSLNVPWKIQVCLQGESCWCRFISPEIPIETCEGINFNIISPGIVNKKCAEYFVKLHNKSL